MIKVILIQDIRGQGKKGDIINVSDGFARNFLLPQNKAVIATNEALQMVEGEQKNRLEEEKKLSEKNEALKKQLENLSLEVKKKTEAGKLFGSVNAKDIVVSLEARGLKISPKSIIIEKPIKSVGEHVIGVLLDKNTKADLKIKVVEEE